MRFLQGFALSVLFLMFGSAGYSVETSRCPKAIKISIGKIQARSDASLEKENMPFLEEVKVVRDLLAALDIDELSDLRFYKVRMGRGQCGYALNGQVDRSGKSVYETRIVTMNGSDVLRVSIKVSDSEPVWMYFTITDYDTNYIKVSSTKANVRGYLAPHEDRGGTPRYIIGYASEVLVK